MKSLFLLVILALLSHLADVLTTYRGPLNWEKNSLLSLSFEKLGFWPTQLVHFSLLILFGSLLFPLYLNTLGEFMGRPSGTEMFLDSMRLTLTSLAVLRAWPAIRNVGILLQLYRYREEN